MRESNQILSAQNKGASYSGWLIFGILRPDPLTATLAASATGGHTAWDLPLPGKGSTNPRCNRGCPAPAGLDDGNGCEWWWIFLNHSSLSQVVMMWCITLYFPICWSALFCLFLLYVFCIILLYYLGISSKIHLLFSLWCLSLIDIPNQQNSWALLKPPKWSVSHFVQRRVGNFAFCKSGQFATLPFSWSTEDMPSDILYISVTPSLSSPAFFSLLFSLRSFFLLLISITVSSIFLTFLLHPFKEKPQMLNESHI